MKTHRDPGMRPVAPLPFAVPLLLALAATLSAADAPVFGADEVETRPVLLSATPLVSPALHLSFGARIQLEFVVDEQGRPRDPTPVDVKATFSETGNLVREADLPILRRIGLLNGFSPDATFAEITDLITRPFLEAARQALLARRYRPGSRNGVAVASRTTDVLEFRTDDRLARERLRPTPQAMASALPSAAPDPAAAIPPAPETMTVPEPPRPSLSTQTIIAAGALAERGGTVTTPGQPMTSIVASGDGRTLFTPGQPPTTVVSNAGGRTLYTPGQTPTTVVSVSSTESIIYTPGQPQSTIVATPGGGSTIYTPGQPPTTVVPIGDGGSIIYAPGQPPVTVMPSP